MGTPVVKLKKLLWRDVVYKNDPDAKSLVEDQYRFSNGRTFTKNRSRNRTA